MPCCFGGGGGGVKLRPLLPPLRPALQHGCSTQYQLCFQDLFFFFVKDEGV